MASEHEEDFTLVYRDASAVSEEETSWDACQSPDSTLVRVDGVNVDMSMEHIELYFENKKRSGGGGIQNVCDHRAQGFVLLSFQNPEDAEEVLKKRQALDGMSLKVSRHTVQGGCGQPVSSQDMATGEDNAETSPCISVRGLSMSYSEEALTNYFENKRRSGGGEVEAVTKVDREGVFYVKFVNPEDAARVASQEHSLNGQKVEVRVYTPPQTLADRVLVRGLPYLETGTELGLYMESRADSEVKSIFYGDEGMAVVIFRENIDFQKVQEGVNKRQFKNVTLVVEPLAGCCTVQVRNLPTSPCASEEMLTNYFENERRSGGGEVTNVQLGEKGDYALITFADFKAASEVLGRSHKLAKSELSVAPFYDCLGPSGGRASPPVKIPERQSLSQSARSKILHLREVPDLHLEIESLLRKHHACIPEFDSSESVYIECILTQETEGVHQLAAKWPQDAKNAVEDHLNKITVEEVKATPEVFSQTEETVRNISEQAGAFLNYDAHQGRIVFVTTRTRWDFVAEVKKTVAKTEEKIRRKSMEKCVEIPINAKAYSFFVRNHRVMQDILKRSPQLRVSYDQEKELLKLTGVDSEVDEVKTLCQKVAVCEHTWDMEITRKLFRQGDAQRVLKTLCRESDPDTAIDFTEDGITIYSLEENQAIAMKREICGKYVRVKKIPLPSEFKDAETWTTFKRKFEEHSRGAVAMKEELNCLIVVGVGENFDTCCDETERFREENAIVVADLSVDQKVASLITTAIHCRYGYSSVLRNVREVAPNKDVISVTGTRQAVSDIQRFVEDLKKNQTVITETFELPSFARYLASHTGQREVKDIEHRLECKIIDQTQQCFALLISGQGSGSAHNSLQPGQGAAQGIAGLTCATADSSDGGQQRPTRNFADPKPQPEPKRTRDELPAKPRVFLNPMSDITKEEHNVLVNSSNTLLNLSYGQVSKDLLRVGGPGLQKECTGKYPKGISYGEIAVTGKGQENGLFCKNIFHCCLKEEKDGKKIKKMIKETTTKCLEKANEMGHSSIGFPALGTGNLQFPPKTVAEAMFKAAIKFGRKHPDCCLSDVVIILHKKDEEVTKAFKEVKEKYTVVPQDPAYDLHTNPNAQGVKKHLFFENSSKPVTLVFVALKQGVAKSAAQELVAGYHRMVSDMKPLDAPDLQSWDDFHIGQLIYACRIRSVNLTFMFESDKIQLRGFRYDVGMVPYSTIMKDAEEYIHTRKSAHIMARQVRWSWVEVGMTGEKLRAYDETNNYMIEKSYRKNKATVFVFDTNNQAFMIRFDTMDEIPENLPPDQTLDEPVRVIRQDLIHEVPDAPLPPHWSRMRPNDLFDEILLKEDSIDYKRTAELFRKSYQQPSCQIVKISRIQNPTLYRQYLAKMMELKNSLPPDTHVEREPLWHGTKGDSVQSIIHLGFNRSYCRQDGARNAYGDGVYFATTAEYASRDEYATADPLGQRHVFLCRVLVGQYTAGTRGMRVLPAVTGAGGRCYNSAVDDPADPRMFVVFSDIQAYPKYLIVFK